MTKKQTAIIEEQPTSELLADLIGTSEFKKYHEAHQGVFVTESLGQALTRIVNEKKLKKSIVIRNSEMSEVYGYQIFSGLKRPERGKLLSLVLSMKLSLEETQKLLKTTGYSPLYAKNEADCVVIYGILHGYTTVQVNEMLYKYRLPSL